MMPMMNKPLIWITKIKEHSCRIMTIVYILNYDEVGNGLEGDISDDEFENEGNSSYFDVCQSSVEDETDSNNTGYVASEQSFVELDAKSIISNGEVTYMNPEEKEDSKEMVTIEIIGSGPDHTNKSFNWYQKVRQSVERNKKELYKMIHQCAMFIVEQLGIKMMQECFETEASVFVRDNRSLAAKISFSKNFGITLLVKDALKYSINNILSVLGVTYDS